MVTVPTFCYSNMYFWMRSFFSDISCIIYDVVFTCLLRHQNYLACLERHIFRKSDKPLVNKTFLSLFIGSMLRYIIIKIPVTDKVINSTVSNKYALSLKELIVQSTDVAVGSLELNI